MPKVQRTPPKGQDDSGKGEPGQPAAGFEALLLAMEGRLSAKLEKASEASRKAAEQAKLNSESLEQLESRVDANEEYLMNALKESEARIMAKVTSQMEDIVQGQVKDMVAAQLTAAGFDPELSAADLTVRRSAMQATSSVSYAGMAAAKPPARQAITERSTLSKEDRRETSFWVARRSLRLWPLLGGSRESLEDYVRTKLRMDQSFVDEELGQVAMRKPKEPRNRNTDEYIVTFETKQIRDAVKAAAANLANYRETAGMRLHVPDHLLRGFQALMNLSFDLKKKNPNLKRNVKFDEEDCGLYMDLKMNETADWKRVKPEQAAAATKNRRGGRTRSMGEDELRGLLGEENE